MCSAHETDRDHHREQFLKRPLATKADQGFGRYRVEPLHRTDPAFDKRGCGIVMAVADAPARLSQGRFRGFDVAAW